jgi:hypothetical protein
VIVHNGVAVVSNAFGTQSVRSGFELVVTANAAPGTPTPVNMNRLRAVTLLLASQGSQTGGARQRPDEATAVRNNIGTPRAPVVAPNFDLPATGDDLIRSRSRTRVQPY